MRFCNSVFATVLKPLDRRSFKSIVDRATPTTIRSIAGTIAGADLRSAQHLELSRFLGNNQNAIQLQIIAAMIAYLLLRLAAHTHALKLPALRLAERVRSALFVRKPMANLHNPPPLPLQTQAPPAQTSRSSAMPDFPRTALPPAGRGPG
jgi:hypothetical protein